MNDAVVAHKEPGQCQVRDKLFVEPCSMLNKYMGTAFDSWRGWDFNKNAPTRTFITMKRKMDGKQWAINCCPFCGVRIDAPFVESETSQEAAE